MNEWGSSHPCQACPQPRSSSPARTDIHGLTIEDEARARYILHRQLSLDDGVNLRRADDPDSFFCWRIAGDAKQPVLV